MTGLIILSVINILVTCVMICLFYYQHKRQEALSDRNMVLSNWCKTLMENEETLSKDIAKLHYEIKNIKVERK